MLSLALLIAQPIWYRPAAADVAPTPDPPMLVRLGQVPHNPAAELALQIEVDWGHMLWRLDPLEVARAEGPALGFAAGDRFAPGPRPTETSREAIVRVVHAGWPHEISLVQPIRSGLDAIWVIDEIRAGRDAARRQGCTGHFADYIDCVKV
jgi:hypothetical protein